MLKARSSCFLDQIAKHFLMSNRQNSIPKRAGRKEPVTVIQFYHSHAFPYLIEKHAGEIRQQLKEAPETLRQHELVSKFEPLGETSGDTAWQVFRNYLDKIERRIAAIVRRHSPSFWFHLHRRLRPMLSDIHEGKTDDTTVALVRGIAELAYAKHGDINRTNDLGPIHRTRLKTFLDGSWYKASARVFDSKLRAKREYQIIRSTGQVVMIDFRESDLCDVFEVEGLCYEYWWASAAMRAIGKGSVAKWDSTKSPSLLYKDTAINPVCFDFYDQRNSENTGFHTRLGTWIDEPEQPEKADTANGEKIHFAQLTPNPKLEEYPIWNDDTKSMDKAIGATNFGIGIFPLGNFKRENSFMAEAFKQNHSIELNAVLFALWAASFFATYPGLTTRLPTQEMRLDRTMTNWGNLLFRGYAMVNFNLDQLAQEAVYWAKQLNHEYLPTIDEARQGVEFISVNKDTQKNIGLWSGGKRPVLIPSMNGLMIDLAAILPFLYTIFFGLRKVQQIGGAVFEDSVRRALLSRGFEICLQGKIRWPTGNPREVDAGVRIGDRLLLIECFSYELPLDYELGKPSVFDKRKEFVLEKLDQAQALAKRIKNEPTGMNFDVSWAKEIDWRVVSPFVEFAWHLEEPLIDQAGLPRLLQVRELIDNLSSGVMPAERHVAMLKKLRDFPFKGTWY